MKMSVAKAATPVAVFAFAQIYGATHKRRQAIQSTWSLTVITFFKRALDSYINSAGRYPLPMMWTF